MDRRDSSLDCRYPNVTPLARARRFSSRLINASRERVFRLNFNRDSFVLRVGNLASENICAEQWKLFFKIETVSRFLSRPLTFKARDFMGDSFDNLRPVRDCTRLFIHVVQRQTERTTKERQPKERDSWFRRTLLRHGGPQNKRMNI